MTLLLHQLRFERMLFRRNPSAAFFNFVLPLVLLLLVASVFADDDEELDLLIPGIAGMSIMATTFTALAFNVTFLREQGILKRIRGTPLPPRDYLGALVGSSARYRVTYEQNGHRVEHETDDPTGLLHELTSQALEHGERLENLNVTRPSLEDVYLELTRETE